MPLPWENKLWYQQYQRALLEIDPASLTIELEAAKAAIYRRVEELGYSENESVELVALSHAMKALHLMAEHEHLRKKL